MAQHYMQCLPKPPTPEAVARAQFVDKTYVWKGAAPKAQLP
jgi:hypothetical protein